MCQATKPKGKTMNSLKAKTKILCGTCGCTMRRTKTIKVAATNEADAKVEAREKIAAWTASLRGQDCKTCKSIKADVAEQDAEMQFEMRAAFGRGAKVVNVLTGERFTT